MRELSEITKASDEELFAKAKHRIESFPILKGIYDDKFLSMLVRNKNDYDNALLLWLVTDDPNNESVAVCLFQEIEQNLRLLQPEGSVQKFKPKLVQWNSIYFESGIAELDLVAEYKKKGYQIELEPILPNGGKADFCVGKGCLRIYFEVKCIFWRRSLEEEAMIDELHVRLGRMNEPFMISIDIKKSLKRRQVAEVSKYIQKRLREADQAAIRLPFSFAYLENGEPIVVVDINLRLPIGERGFISGFTYGGGIKGDWSDLRRKISSGVSQLHPDYPGVIVIQPHGLGTSQYDIQNALWGDLAWNPYRKPEVFRWKDRIFAKNKNTRLSAVLYLQRRLQASGYTKKKIIYHNPYAKTRLSAEFFEGENVTQFIPTKLDKW